MAQRLLYEELAEVERTGTAAALATVVRARGAVPRHAGSKMLVYADGRVVGTVGGGEMEDRVRQAGLQSLTDGEPRMLHYVFQDPAQGDPGVCGGEVEVFVEPVGRRATIVVMGGGHVGQAVLQLVPALLFKRIIDDAIGGRDNSQLNRLALIIVAAAFGLAAARACGPYVYSSL